MEISQSCLDLIKEFEGLRLKAYLDPADIPTIGYGSIRYPNGTKVRIGDSISVAEAEAFLRFECENTSARVSAITNGIQLNQNQYDALISFCFNIGLGAFSESRLLKKLRSNDFVGAAAEFPRWNKATVDGVKSELPGLTKRRAKEKALFEQLGVGGASFTSSASIQEKVLKAKIFLENKKNIIVGFTGENQPIDIIELKDVLPDTIIAAIKNYPNLESFTVAAAGELIPAGERAIFSGLALSLPKIKSPPKFLRSLLALGVEDDEDHPGQDVKNMQVRLADIGYYFGKIDGIFGLATDEAVRDFQSEFFGVAEADGRVGPKTWKKLWGEGVDKPLDTGVASGKNFLKLLNTNRKDKFGCVVLVLSYYKNGVLTGSIEVCSGQPRKQIFRIGSQSPAGSMEPLPEGRWRIKDIEWAGGKDNYTGQVWNNGLGPAKIRLDYLSPGSTSRSAIEIHIDWNRPGAPGTAGCVGVQNISDFKLLATWLRDTDPKELFVDWGLGTCPAP